MSFFAAALWVTGATLGFLLLASVLFSMRQQASGGQLVLVACQVAAYLFVLFLLLRNYAPNTEIRVFLALRDTHAGFYPLALLLGAACSVPANWLFEQIVKRWPQEDNSQAFVELFFAAGTAQRLLLTFAVVVVGPIVEELLFRGAIFGPLARKNRMSAVIVVSAVFFALVHMEPRVRPPILLMGLMLGYLRASSGSILPAVLMHVGFNGAEVLGLWLASGPPKDSEPAASVSLPVLVAATVACVGLLLLAGLIAKASSKAHRARQADRD